MYLQNENNEKYYEKLSEDLCGICYEPFENIMKTQVYCLNVLICIMLIV